MPKTKFEDTPYIRPDYEQYARNIELWAQGISLSPLYDALLESPPAAGNQRRIRRTVSAED